MDATKNRELGELTDDQKLYVDAAQPATLNNGADKLTDHPRLQEAVMALSKRSGRRLRYLVGRSILRPRL